MKNLNSMLLKSQKKSAVCSIFFFVIVEFLQHVDGWFCQIKLMRHVKTLFPLFWYHLHYYIDFHFLTSILFYFVTVEVQTFSGKIL